MEENLVDVLEAILRELQTISGELRALRSELTGRTEPARPALTTPPSTNHSTLEPQAEPTPLPQLDPRMGSQSVCDWLASIGITVKNYREPTATDAVFDQLSLFLGDRFPSLARLHDLIRQRLSTGEGFSLNLASRPQEEIANVTQFCSMLYSLAFLSSYKYNKSTKTIYATPQRVGKVINFFTGGWFERYVYLKIAGLFTRFGIPFSCLLNPQITFANGDDFELDLMFLVEDEPLWIECKTGDFQCYITKYSDVRKQLWVPKSRAILAILGLADRLTSDLTNLYDVTVVNESTILEGVCTAIGRQDLLPEITSPSVEITPVPRSVATILNKAGLRPIPEFRRQVLQAMVRLMLGQPGPITMAEVKRLFAQQFPLSKSQLQDLLNAVIRGGCCLDAEGQPVASFTTSFERLVSDDVDELERRCVEAYARAVMATVPGYFDDPQAAVEFERVVGARLPVLDELLADSDGSAR